MSEKEDIVSDLGETTCEVVAGAGMLGCGCFSLLVQIGAAVIGLLFVAALFNACIS